MDDFSFQKHKQIIISDEKMQAWGQKASNNLNGSRIKWGIQEVLANPKLFGGPGRTCFYVIPLPKIGHKICIHKVNLKKRSKTQKEHKTCL